MFKLLTLCEARHLEAGVHAICRWVQVPDRPDNTTGYDDPVAAAQTIESPKHKLPIRSMAKVIVSWLLVVCLQVVHVTYIHQQHITSQHNIVQFVMCCLQDPLACSPPTTQLLLWPGHLPTSTAMTPRSVRIRWWYRRCRGTSCSSSGIRW